MLCEMQKQNASIKSIFDGARYKDKLENEMKNIR